MYSHSLDLVFDLVKALFELGLAMVCIWFVENSLKENLCEILKGLIEDFQIFSSQIHLRKHRAVSN